MKKFNIFDSFVIKIIAMVTMTFDHLGVVIKALWGASCNPIFYEICRYIGRFAMPLYVFMIVEGVLHTKNYKKYALKLGILALAIFVVLITCYYWTDLGLQSLAEQGNIFLDLLLGSVMIYLLNQKNNYLKPLAILPLVVAILSFTAKCIEWNSSCTSCGGKVTVLWYPAYLRLQYDWLSLALMLGYFLSYYASRIFYKIREESTGLSADMMRGTNEERIVINIFAFMVTVLINVFYYMFKYMNPNIVWWDANCQLFGMVAGLVLIFYSGNRGYNKKWFNTLAYLYYPMHIVLVYGICYFIFICVGGLV